MAIRKCAHCGKDFEYKRFDHWFCSAKCVAAFYRAHPNPEQIHSELPHDKPHVCEECGMPFTVNAYAERGGKRAPKYCSPKCKQKAYRQRGKDTQEQAERRYTRDGFHTDNGQNAWDEFRRRYEQQYGTPPHEDRNQQQRQQQQRQQQQRQQQQRQQQQREEWKCTYANAVYILGLTGTWNADDLRKAYHAKMMEWHPDRNHSEEATKMAQRINAAYEYLKR